VKKTAGLFSLVRSDRTRGNGHKQEVPSEHQETLLHCEDDRALARFACRGCGVSLPGNAQKLFGHGPGPPALGGPASVGGLD